MRSRTRRGTWGAITAAVPLAVTAIVLAACAPQADEPVDATPSTSAAPASTSPSTTPEAPSASPSAPQPDEAVEAWESFSTGDGTIAFRYPASWRLAHEASDPIPAAGPDGDRVVEWGTLTAPNGQSLLEFGGLIDTGSVCPMEDRRPYEVLAREPAPADEVGESIISTVANERADGGWQVGIGLASETELAHGDCGVRFLVGTSQGGAYFGTAYGTSTGGDPDPLWDVATLDDARSYMETDEYATILEILRSVELR